MKRGKLKFTTIIQDSKEFGSNDERMVSRIFFEIHVGRDVHAGFFCDVKHTVGSETEPALLEVSLPPRLADVVDYQEFRSQVEKYYREAASSVGSSIQFGHDAPARMQHNLFNHHKVVDIEILNSREPGG